MVRRYVFVLISIVLVAGCGELLSPTSSVGYYAQGVLHYSDGAYDEAIAYFSKSIELKPEVLTYNDRGWAYRSKGNLDKAITDFSTAIELRPDFAKSYFNRGLAYGVKGMYSKATAG